jgi:hypothetical protein
MQEEFIQPLLSAFDFVLFLLPIVIPVLLIYFGFEFFVHYKRTKHLNNLDWVLLEINPPAEVKKSPAAMELFLLALHQTGGEGNWYAKYIKGSFRSWFSLELVSIEGNVKYFIRTEKKHVRSIESSLYAQYPGIEVSESENNYTDGFYADDEKFGMFAAELGLTKDDPYPIKTYVDYNLDNEQEDEFKIDPMAPILEFLSTVKPRNNVWFQILVRAHKKEDLDFSKTFPRFSKKIDNWEEKGKEEIKKIKEQGFLDIEEGEGDEKKIKKTKVDTQGQKELISALERSLSKYAFDVGIRLVTIAPKEDFDKGNIGMLGVWKQYSSLNLNGFKPKMVTDFDFWYQDMFKTKIKKMKKNILEAYKTRNYFWKDDYKGNPRKYFILNTEELATIYHFLGKTTEAPTISKVDARKSAPPTNLPI